MVSGFLTSPWDQVRISSAAARPIRISSKKLTSSTDCTSLSCQKWWSVTVLGSRTATHRGGSSTSGSVHQFVDRGRLVAGQVDSEVGRSPLEIVVVGIAHLDGGAVRGQHLHVQAERLELFEEHLERFGDARLRDVLALDDGFVDLDAADDVIALDGEELLERVRRAIGLHGPALHLTEALATEPGLTAERLLGDHRVRTRRPGVDLVVHQVEQLDDVHVADGHRVRERLSGATVHQRGLAVDTDETVTVAGRRGGAEQPDDLFLGGTVEDRRRRAGEGTRTTG